MTAPAKPSPATVRVLLDLQDVPLSEVRCEEIAIEASRLHAGVSSLKDRLDYFDEPATFSAVLRGTADGS